MPTITSHLVLIHLAGLSHLHVARKMNTAPYLFIYLVVLIFYIASQIVHSIETQLDATSSSAVNTNNQVTKFAISELQLYRGFDL